MRCMFQSSSTTKGGCNHQGDTTTAARRYWDASESLERHVGALQENARRSRRVGDSSEAIDKCTGTRYVLSMIRSFHHRGLRRLYERGDPSGVGANQLDRITLALADLDATSKPSDVDLPGYRLHPL